MRNRDGRPPPRQELDKMLVFSMDIIALYPSIKQEMAMGAIAEAIKRTDLTWENVNVNQQIFVQFSKKLIFFRGYFF